MDVKQNICERLKKTRFLQSWYHYMASRAGPHMEGKLIYLFRLTSPASPQWIMITAGTKSLPIRRGNQTSFECSKWTPVGKDCGVICATYSVATKSLVWGLASTSGMFPLGWRLCCDNWQPWLRTWDGVYNESLFPMSLKYREKGIACWRLEGPATNTCYIVRMWWHIFFLLLIPCKFCNWCIHKNRVIQRSILMTVRTRIFEVK